MRSSAREWPHAVLAAALAATLFAIPQVLRARAGMPLAFGAESYALRSPHFTDAATLTHLLVEFPFFFPLIGGIAIGMLWMVLSGTTRERAAIVAIAALSPAFLANYGTPSAAAVPTALVLCAMLLRNSLLSCAVIGVLLGAESVVLAVIGALMLFGYRQLRNGLVLAGGAVLGFLLHPQLLSAVSSGIPFAQSIAEFGGTAGIPAMAVLLALFGYRYWRMPLPLVGAILLTPWFGTLVLPLAAVGIAVAGGSAFAAFGGLRWQHQGFRFVTLTLIACGMLFSTVVSIQHAARADPTADYWALREFSGVTIADQPAIIEGLSNMRVVNVAHTREERGAAQLLNDELQTDNWYLIGTTFRKHDISTVVLSDAATYPWAAKVAGEGSLLLETPTLTVWDVRNI